MVRPILPVAAEHDDIHGALPFRVSSHRAVRADPDPWPARTAEVVRVSSDTGGRPCIWDRPIEQQALQDHLRSYFAGLVEEGQRTDDPEPSYTRVIRRMGHDGWLGLGWPPEFGGQGRGPIDQMIFVEESHWAGVPLPLLTLNSVGPTPMTLGTDEQKERILPGILRGEVHFSIGYTEPRQGPIWRRCVPGPFGTGTST